MMPPRPIMGVIHPANDIGRVRFNNNVFMMQAAIRG